MAFNELDFLNHVLFEIGGYILSDSLLSESNKDLPKLHQTCLKNMIINVKGLHARNLIDFFTCKTVDDKTKKCSAYKFDEICYSAIHDHTKKIKSFKDCNNQLCTNALHLSVKRDKKNQYWQECFELMDKYMVPNIKEFLLFLKIDTSYDKYGKTIDFLLEQLEFPHVHKTNQLLNQVCTSPYSTECVSENVTGFDDNR